MLSPIIIANPLMLGHKYMLQGAGNETAFNAPVRDYIKGISIRWFFLTLLLIFAIISAGALDWRSTAVNMLFIAYNYVPCIMIRKRDKKPFFERNKSMATEGAQ